MLLQTLHTVPQLLHRGHALQLLLKLGRALQGESHLALDLQQPGVVDRVGGRGVPLLPLVGKAEGRGSLRGCGTSEG